MRSYLRPSTHRRTSANTRSAGFRRVGRVDIPAAAPSLPPASLVKSRKVLYHALHSCPLPRPEYLLNRLAADLSTLSPASIAPLVSTSSAPAISWLSEPLSPLLMKPVKHFCWVPSSYLQGPCHTYLAFGGVRIRLTGNGISPVG